MIYSFVGNFPDHRIENNGKKIKINITGTGDGLFVRQLEVYLGNCDECNQNQLNYQIGFLPRYSNNETETGLELFLTFTNNVTYFGDEKEL